MSRHSQEGNMYHVTFLEYKLVKLFSRRRACWEHAKDAFFRGARYAIHNCGESHGYRGNMKECGSICASGQPPRNAGLPCLFDRISCYVSIRAEIGELRESRYGTSYAFRLLTDFPCAVDGAVVWFHSQRSSLMHSAIPSIITSYDVLGLARQLKKKTKRTIRTCRCTEVRWHKSHDCDPCCHCH